MKKYFLSTITTVIITLSVNAQSLQLLNKENEIIEDSSITLHAEEGANAIECYIHVKNITVDYIEVKVKKKIIEDLGETQNVFCWAGHCYPPQVFVSPLSDTILPDSINDSFHATLKLNGATGNCKMMYVFFDVNNESDSIAITVNYTTDNTGIIDFKRYVNSFSEASPNPANSFFSIAYAFTNKVENAKIAVSSLSGVNLEEISLNSLKGTISVHTQQFAEGTYLYSLIVNNIVFKTNKLIVKH